MCAIQRSVCRSAAWAKPLAGTFGARTRAFGASIFDALDTDRDGTLTREEARRAGVSDAVFDQIDTDRRGTLSREDWEVWEDKQADRLDKFDNTFGNRVGLLDWSEGHRMERDLLGEMKVPMAAYYGIQTLRAIRSYNITNVRIMNFPDFIVAFAMIKKACALANHKLGLMDIAKKNAICRACDELIDPDDDKHGPNQGRVMRANFLVDMVQGGAGTSTNMNANEVIANRALEILGKERGQYEFCHPNDDVNKGQSTNDAYPTSAKLALILMHKQLYKALENLSKAFHAKGDEFAGVVKMGRTQLQDAVPMTLGQEFHAYGTTVAYELSTLQLAMEALTNQNMGGTAIGTSIAADKHFSATVVQELRLVTDLPMKVADDLIEASSSVADMLALSGTVRRSAVKISKICNDLRLLASGPRCGFGEINLPAMAPGSSIMPGKVNPVIPEVMNQCAFEVIGNDVTVAFAAEAGQLELNVMEPVIIFKLFSSIRVLSHGVNTLRESCVEGITANEEHCKELVTNSIGIVTALLPHIGYKNCTMAAALALQEKRPVGDIVVEKGFLKREELEELLRPEAMCGPTA